MTIFNSSDPDGERNTRLLFALNAAAAQLQRSARSEADVYRAFYDQIVKIGLTGSINLLCDEGENLNMVVAAVSWERIVPFESLAGPDLKSQWASGEQTIQFTIPVSASEHFARILERGESVFEEDSRKYIRQIIPHRYQGIAEDVIANFGGQPAIYAPLVIGGDICGLLTVNGYGLSVEDVPSVEAFANHAAIALENARLFTALQAQVVERKQTEDALRESERKYRSIVRQSTDGIILVNEQGIVIEWNEGQERITGLKQSQVLGRSIWDVQFQMSPGEKISEEYKQRLVASTQELLEKGQSPWSETLHENDIRRPDGEMRTIQVVIYPLSTEKGYMICSIIRDITERREMEQALRRRADELSVLQTLSLDLTTVHELPVLLSNIVDKAVQLLGAKGGSLYLSEPELEQVRLYVESQEVAQEYIGVTLKLGEGAAGSVALSGVPLIIDNYQDWPGRSSVFDNIKPYTAVLTVPMIWQGQVTGVLQVLDDINFRQFNKADQELLSLFANHASVALETTRLLEAERRRRQEAETLGKASAALTSTLELDQLLSVILTHLEQVVPYVSASVFLLEGRTLRIVAGRGFDNNVTIVGNTFPVDEDSLFLEIQRSRRSLVLEDVQMDPRFHGWGGVKHVRGWLGTPLIVRGEVIGCLTLDNDQKGVYHAGHAALVEAFANQAATVIEKARLFEAERMARERAEAMRDAAHIISSSLSLKQVLEAVLDQLARVLSYDSGNVMLLEEDSAIIMAWRGYQKSTTEEMVKSVRFGLSAEHAIGTVVKSEAPLLIADVGQDPRWQDTPLSQHIKSWLGVPLIVRGKVIGLFNLDRSVVGGFNKEHVALVQSFAAHAAVAIDNARLFEQAATERRHLRLLYDIGREMASSMVYEEILDRAISLTCQVFDGVIGQAFLYIPETEQLRLCALSCKEDSGENGFEPGLEIDLGIGLAGWAAQNRKPAYVLDVSQDERWHFVPGLDDGVQSVITSPILSGKHLFGVLSVMHDQVAAFSNDQLDLLQTICNEVGLALSNADRYQEVKRRLAEITLIQNLTEVFNRRLDLQVLLDEVVEQLYQRFNYPLVEIFLISGDQLILQSYRGNFPEITRQSIQEGIVGRVAHTGQANFIPDVSEDPDYICSSPETTAELAVPIFRDNKVIGVINIESQRPDQLTEHDSDLLQVLAGQISIALENAVLYEQVRQHAEELELTVGQRTTELTSLYELSQKIGYTLGYEDLLRLLLSHLRSAIGCELSSACLALEGYRLFYVESNREVSSDAMRVIRDASMRELVNKNPGTKKLETAPLEVIHTSDFNSQIPIIENTASMIFAPVMLGRKPVGALVAASDQENAFSDYQQRLLETFAHQAASAVERIAAILAAEQKRVEGLVEHLPVGVILLDADYRLLVANPLARMILAALDTDIESGYLTRLENFPIEDLIYRYREPLPVEIAHEGPPRMLYEAQARPMGQGSQQWVIMVREVTQEREIQTRIQMQDRLATVGQLAAGIAHDFNNIMAAILVYTDLLMGDPNLPKASRDRLAIIEQQVQRAASLIRQILDFSRRAVMEQSSLDLLPFVKELERMLARVMPETIRLELAYKPGAYVVNADPTRLQQVFINLAVNARDAMPEGGVLHFSLDKVQIMADEEPPLPDMQPGEWIRITARDTGSGIPSEVIPHIFEPFFTTKPVGQGTGLGLAQVYGIIKQHEGHIDVSSTVGEGTEFVLYLPALPELVYEARHTEPLAPLDGSGKLVLVVEDDQATLAALQALLEAKNYDVITARNGYEAIQLYDRSGELISLVVSDVVMPQMDGVKLYRALLERTPEMKVLFVTGHPLEGESQALLEKGDVHWLQKPFSARDFTRMVQNLMEV